MRESTRRFTAPGWANRLEAATSAVNALEEAIEPGHADAAVAAVKSGPLGRAARDVM